MMMILLTGLYPRYLRSYKNLFSSLGTWDQSNLQSRHLLQGYRELNPSA